MKAIHLATLIIILTAPPMAFAQSDNGAAGKTMLSFLKRGMHLGVRSVEGTSDVLLSVYDDEQLNIAKALVDRQVVRATDFASKFPPVQKQLDEYVEKSIGEHPDMKAEEVEIMPTYRTSFWTLRSVGSDFILIQAEGELTRKRVLPKSRIGHIDLDAKGAHFLTRRVARR